MGQLFAVEISYRGVFQKSLAKNICRGIVLAAHCESRRCGTNDCCPVSFPSRRTLTHQSEASARLLREAGSFILTLMD